MALSFHQLKQQPAYSMYQNTKMRNGLVNTWILPPSTSKMCHPRSGRYLWFPLRIRNAITDINHQNLTRDLEDSCCIRTQKRLKGIFDFKHSTHSTFYPIVLGLFIVFRVVENSGFTQISKRRYKKHVAGSLTATTSL